MAARELSRAGARVIVLEARARIGGRICTERVPGWDLPVEIGAEFVHGQPESTLALAREAGVDLVALEDRHALRTPNGLVPGGGVWSRIAQALHSDVAQADTSTSSDMSLSDYLGSASLPAADRSLLVSMVEGFEAAPISDLSLESLREEFDNRPPGQFRPSAGYGALLARLYRTLGTSVRVHLETPVAVLRWAGLSGVHVLARDGRRFVAPRAIVTVPLPLLRPSRDWDSGFVFDPPITAHEQALAHLGMGQAVRIVLRFSSRLWPEDLGFDFIHMPGAPLPTCWLQSNGTSHQATAWAGGPAAQALKGVGEEALRTLALRCVAAALGAPPELAAASFIGSYSHDFQGDPFSLGAYSYARPGGTGAARALQEPLEGVLFLAGEATDTEAAGTVAGALASGARAARQVLDRL